MKRKTETKIQSKYQLFVVLFIIILHFYSLSFCFFIHYYSAFYSYPTEFRNQILKIQSYSSQ